MTHLRSGIDAASSPTRPFWAKNAPRESRSNPLIAADRALGGRACLINFHRVAHPQFRAKRPDRGFYLDTMFLDRVLSWLRRAGWSIVTLDRMTEALRSGIAGERLINFSIDDCYRDTWELAVPVFKRHGMPVTLFVTTGIPERTCSLWTSGLETLLQERKAVHLPSGEILRVETASSKRRAFRQIRAIWEASNPVEHYTKACALNGVDPAELHRRNGIDWWMLQQLAADPLVEIGCHTETHPRMSAIDDARARQEIFGSKKALEERLRVPVRHLAWPYGRAADWGERDRALAREAGFTTISTTRKGVMWRGQQADLMALPRITLNGDHRDMLHFWMHLTGVSSIAAAALGRI